MSVIHFDSAELANVALYLASSKYTSPAYLRQVLADLATYSEINTKAYNERYNGADATPVPFADLVNGASIQLSVRPYGVTKDDLANAKGTLRLLDYNTDDAHHTPAYDAAMKRLLAAAYSRLIGEVEADV